MTEETAQLLLALITAVALAAWVAGVQFMLRSKQKPPVDEELMTSQSDGELAGNWLHTSAEVAGEPASLAGKATALLAREGTGLGTLKILERGSDRVGFAQAGTGTAVANQTCPGLRGGELRFTAVGGGRTRIDVFLQVAQMRWLLWLGAGFLFLGLIAIVVGCWTIFTYVIPSPLPGVRWQTLQMLQVVHFLWPPFLLGGLYRRLSRAALVRFEALIHNLPYLPDQ
jgi:hypothetical protein